MPNRFTCTNELHTGTVRPSSGCKLRHGLARVLKFMEDDKLRGLEFLHAFPQEKSEVWRRVNLLGDRSSYFWNLQFWFSSNLIQKSFHVDYRQYFLLNIRQYLTQCSRKQKFLHLILLPRSLQKISLVIICILIFCTEFAKYSSRNPSISKFGSILLMW